MHTPLRYRDAYTFLFPLIFMAELIVLSQTSIHAFIARLEAPAVSLAAFATAFAFHTTLGSPLWSLPMIAVSFLNSRQAARQLIVFVLPVLVATLVVDLLVTFTSLGDWLFGSVFGGSAAVVEQARYAVLLMYPVMPLVVVRASSMALLMMERKTYLITLGTLVRLGALVAFLAMVPPEMPGAVAGALAHSVGIAVETGLMMAMAWRAGRRLPLLAERPHSIGGMWRFSFPLMINYVAESGVAVTVNFFLGRLATPDLALATFGVVNGLMSVMLAPLRSLEQTIQVLGKQIADHRRLLMLSAQVIALFTFLMVLIFYTPLQWWVIRDLMGLNDRLSGPVAEAMPYALLTAFFWGFAASLRGLLATLRHTRPMTLSAMGRLGVVVAVGMIVFFRPEANGGIVGVVAVTGAALAEVGILGWAITRLHRGV
ncbi:MAG: hypothetical protein OEW39_00400 [Deltaproteobacteria bacterium]|nr:hypothetical protein [Deltaproteobacteria bacterium]